MMLRAILLLLALLVAQGAQADVRFVCARHAARLERALPAYLKALAIPASLVVTSRSRSALTLSLSTPETDVQTLDFSVRPEFALTTERVSLPAARGFRVVDTVSRKEIVLALLQHGRLTEFRRCSLNALSEQVGVRQNIVAWAENLNWVWPDGGSAKWNPRYWKKGTPRKGVPFHLAVRDVFLQQRHYQVGCYAASKLVLIHGVIDYYRRLMPDPVRARRIEAVLMADGEPLVDVEPGAAWFFEKDFDPRELGRPGKITVLQKNVAPGNFVPGDWAYLQNTDPVSSERVGYEGSNAIYLGRRLFDDYYNDHRHAYTWEQKLDEVYQWRNGVFSRSRHAHRIRPLSAEAMAGLAAAPDQGGLLHSFRIVPRAF